MLLLLQVPGGKGGGGGKGADATTNDSEGKTALMWASGEGHVGVVALLLVHGARNYSLYPVSLQS